MKALSVIICFCTFSAIAQQEPVQSMFWNTNEYYNPAVTGMDYKHKAIVQYRDQWQGLSGASKTGIATYGLRSEKLHGGIGINGLHETVGFNNFTKAGMNYSYHLKIGESVLGIGVQAGIFHMNNPQVYNYVAGEEQFYKSGKSTKFNGGAGLYYKLNKFSIGFSATQLIRSKSAYYYSSTNLWLSCAYDLDLTKNIQLLPSVLACSDGNYTNVNFNLRGVFYKKLQIGASIRNRDSYSFMASYDFFGKFRAGYCFETTISRLNNGVTYGTNEFVLGFLLK